MPLTQPLNIGLSELKAQRELIAQLVRGIEMAQAVSVGYNDLEALTGLQNMLDCISDQVDPPEDTDVTDVTDVIFLWDGDVFAIFPGIAATVGEPNHVTCYQQLGQHGAAALDYCDECDEVKAPPIYADLKVELERIGYNLRVVGKDRMRDSSYADERMAQLTG